MGGKLMKKLSIYVIAITMVASLLLSAMPTVSAENTEEPRPIHSDELLDVYTNQYPSHHSPPGNEDTSEWL